MRRRFSAAALCALLALACTPSQGKKKQTPTATPTIDADRLLRGDEAFRAELRAAVKSKGPDYEPRTEHLRPDGSPKYVNRLILEQSPYLLQHAHNPVNWFPWGDEAFELAEKLDRPIFLSVGYATCHWCHVMEEESFEDEAIAAYLNDHYIPIKVDREQRPDVDAIYMRSVRELTGRGGWPMSVWLTPDKNPFYAATYIPARDGDRGVKKGFFTRLKEQKKAFSEDPEGIADDAERIAERIEDDIKPPESGALPSTDVVVRAVAMADRRYDDTHGGSRGKPKFPSSFPVRLLLRFAARADPGEAKEGARAMALDTLRQMAAGGIHDHVGGGFHRYSVDSRWLVPHFEKMLYDNAQLAIAYLEGYRASGDENLAEVAESTLDYVLREMTSTEGGFYSATDADSLDPEGEREEGRYFTWTPAEIRAALSEPRAKAAIAYYDVTEEGDLEGRNVLHTPRSVSDVAEALSISEEELTTRLEAAREKLREVRNDRPEPLLDDKILVGWNGLMISALARGAHVLEAPRFGEAAAEAARFLEAKLREGEHLHHLYKDGEASGSAFAEDRAFLAAGELDLFELTGDRGWLEHAIGHMDALDAKHRSATGGFYRTTEDHEELLAREVERRDGALPAASSVALMNELRLAALTSDDRWRTRAETTMKGFSKLLRKRPWRLENMLLAVDWYTDAAKEVLIALPEGASLEEEGAALAEVLRERFAPNHVRVVVAEGEQEALTSLVPWVKAKTPKKGRPTAYVCERGACELPTSDPDELAEQLTDNRPYGER